MSGFREIQLTQGKVALVDEEDYERVNQYKWCAAKGKRTYYAMRGKGGKSFQRMHQFIMNMNGVDHIDHNGLNNQKYNLRPATNKQNGYNQVKAKSYKGSLTTSQYKGVSWRKQRKKWLSRITINGKTIYIGLFAQEKEAALAYDRAALKYFGEFAALNFERNV